MVNLVAAAIFLVIAIVIGATKGTVLAIPLFLVAMCFIAYHLNDRRSHSAKR